MKKSWLFVLIIFILSVPTFILMLRPGIFSMQDFHLFRLVEFDKCIRDFQIPCRWAPDSGAGYGEPVFNFYGQFPYWVGEVFHLISFSKIDSIKILFILSLVLSGVGMFFLSQKLWKNNVSALISSIVYLYAPYRAVDVWVRGALPEAISFVFFPLIILEMENYLEDRKVKDLLFFSLLFALLIINHNLSIILFAPFLIIWSSFRFLQTRNVVPFLELFTAGVFSAFLSAFYLLPVIFESKFVNINLTTLGVYDWRANFVKLSQLFISRFWGYGGSIDAKLSLSVGQVQWILPLLILIIILFKFFKNKELTNQNLEFAVLFLIGTFFLFLTHNKSTFIWNALPFMKFIQFPWRFLGVATFSFALASGVVTKELGKFKLILGIGIIITAILLNYNFFRPDIWYSYKDKDLEVGPKWIESTFSSLPDYWPFYGPLPSKEAFTVSDEIILMAKNSKTQIFRIRKFNKWIEFPIAYFPGWKIHYSGQIISAGVSKNGLVFANLNKLGDSTVTLIFENTPVRMVGDLISLGSLGIWLVFLVRIKYAKK